MQALLIAFLLAWQAAVGAAQSAGVPELAPYTVAVAYYETRWGTYGQDAEGCSVGDGGMSYGQHQWHQYGLGAAYGCEVCDTATSYRLITEWLAVHVAAGYTVDEALAPWSVRRQAVALAERMGTEPRAWLGQVVCQEDQDCINIVELMPTLPPGVTPKTVSVQP